MPKGETSRPTNRKNKTLMKSRDPWVSKTAKYNAETKRMERAARADTEANDMMVNSLMRSKGRRK